MKKILPVIILFSLGFYSFADTSKPWTWWWVQGNAMTKKDITDQLEYMHKAGIGGVCLIPCYGQKGREKDYIDLFSPKFMDMIAHTSDETKRLGMGFDMTMGSGWPFGGPWIDEANTSKRLDEKFNCVNAKIKVKRSSPGGHGYAANPFNPDSYQKHIDYVKNVFAPYKDKKILRGFFNDSYEYFNANWTENFLEEFKNRRGYDFTPYYKEVLSQGYKNELPKTLDDETIARMWQDYHETISDLLYDTMLVFTSGAKEMGFLSVNQAHGSVGNLIDLYSIADIPETESFGASKFGIPLVRQDPDYEEWRFGRPNKMMMKFAASSANLTGKKLVASESCTWLTNHFKASLSQVKPELDKLFVGGINHIFYHGTPYSPLSEKFPGRMFYAGTNFNFNSHFKEFFPNLNLYVKRVQEILQNSTSDNDILVYFPIHAFWKGKGDKHKVLMFDVHHASKWLKRCPQFDELITQLDNLGFCFDFVSDKALKDLVANDLYIRANGKYYRTIIVPDCTELPIDTYIQLNRLAESGAKIIFQNKIPSDVTGYSKLAERRQLAMEISNNWKTFGKNIRYGFVPALAVSFGAKRETFADYKLDFIRKYTDNSTVYFIANQNTEFLRADIEISENAEQIEYYNPLNNERGFLKSSNSEQGTKFNLKLMSGETCFIFANQKSNPELKEIKFTDDDSEMEIKGEWTIDFLRTLPNRISGNELPKQIKTEQLKSWTDIGCQKAKEFCGVAKYSIAFNLDNPEASYFIELGDLRDAASIRINGTEIGSIWSVPFRLRIPLGILRNENTLEIEVSNNSFNMARKIAKENPNWNYENNIVDITYTKYDIANKPLEPAGLLGSVKIVKQK